jgi:hypothetical protein
MGAKLMSQTPASVASKLDYATPGTHVLPPVARMPALVFLAALIVCLVAGALTIFGFSLIFSASTPAPTHSLADLSLPPPIMVVAIQQAAGVILVLTCPWLIVMEYFAARYHSRFGIACIMAAAAFIITVGLWLLVNFHSDSSSVAVTLSIVGGVFVFVAHAYWFLRNT